MALEIARRGSFLIVVVIVVLLALPARKAIDGSTVLRGCVQDQNRLKPILNSWHPARRDFISRTFILYYWLSSGDLQFKILIREAVQEG